VVSKEDAGRPPGAGTLHHPLINTALAASSLGLSPTIAVLADVPKYIG
jgi:hypothetical protein